MASSSSAPPPSKISTFQFADGVASSSAAPPPQSNIPTAYNEASSSSAAAAPPQQSKILTLKSSDNDEFEVEESIAVQSGTIKNMVEDGYTVIPLINVDSEILIKILDHMVMHADSDKTDSNKEKIEEFDKEFVERLNFKGLSVLVFAANYLHIPGLMNLLCQTIADRIKNKSVNAVRKIFNVTNDYTPEEEAAVRAEHEWAHEGEFDDTVDDETSEEEEEKEAEGSGENEGESDEEEEEDDTSEVRGEIEEESDDKTVE